MHSLPTSVITNASTQARGNGRFPMLLVEADPLLRRTVVLTARTLGIGDIHETASNAAARRMLSERSFRGAVIALDFGDKRYFQYDLSLIDEIRTADGNSGRTMPVAVLVERCDTALLQELRQRDVTRVILKPFRARILLDTFAEFQALQGA